MHNAEENAAPLMLN